MQWELLVFAAGAVAIFSGCMVPAHRLPALPNDKLLHFSAFGALMLLAGRIAQNDIQLCIWSVCLFAGGWLIEMLQTRVPGRRFCWRDIVANTCGILLAALGSSSAIGT